MVKSSAAAGANRRRARAMRGASSEHRTRRRIRRDTLDASKTAARKLEPRPSEKRKAAPAAARRSAHADKNGDILHGAKNYRLNIPANAPAKDFWSVVRLRPADALRAANLAAVSEQEQQARQADRQRRRLGRLVLRPQGAEGQGSELDADHRGQELVRRSCAYMVRSTLGSRRSGVRGEIEMVALTSDLHLALGEDLLEPRAESAATAREGLARLDDFFAVDRGAPQDFSPVVELELVGDLR